MGWFWGNSSGDEDPTKKLDPGLREYLEKETPSSYVPRDVPLSGPTPGFTEQLQASSTTKDTDESQRSVPTASLYPDGRYAHLWKTYTPMDQMEGPDKAPAAKVVDQFKKRKDLLNHAALENCAEEHIALTNCFKDGDVQQRMWARMTMCSKQNKDFSRCYTMQAVR